VTGVDKSSILLFNREKTELYVAYSNLPEDEQKESFKQENIEWLKNVAMNCENGYRNRVRAEDCPFISGRPTRAIMYASLATKNDKYGIILLEHVFEDIFTEDNLRFLTSIAAQVSIALENSSLYQQMRSMAMVDGLTGAYNRIYLSVLHYLTLTISKNSTIRMDICLGTKYSRQLLELQKKKLEKEIL